MKNESRIERICLSAESHDSSLIVSLRSRSPHWRHLGIGMLLLVAGASASLALDLPWGNSEVSSACQEPLSVRAKAESDYRSCIRLAPGREMLKEKHCKNEKITLKAADKEVSKCKIWASHKIADEYTPKSEAAKG
jgi:hypothetical protein